MAPILQETPYQRIFFRIKQSILDFLIKEQDGDPDLKLAMCAIVATLSEFLCTTARELGIEEKSLVDVIKKTWDMTEESDRSLRDTTKIEN